MERNGQEWARPDLDWRPSGYQPDAPTRLSYGPARRRKTTNRLKHSFEVRLRTPGHPLIPRRAATSPRGPRIVTPRSERVLASQPVDQNASEIHDSSHLSPNSNVLLERSGARSPATLNESPLLTTPFPSASRHMIRYVTMPTTTEWIVSFRPRGAERVDPPFTGSGTKNPVYE